MQLYLTTAPEDAQAAAKWNLPLAHMAYRIGEGSVLLRQNLLLQTQGGLLAITDRDAPLIADPDALCGAAVRECNRRGFGGVLLDFESPLREDRVRLALRLQAQLGASRRLLYVPEHYGKSVPGATVLIGTAVSGGCFTERLQEAVEHFGSVKRLALDVERLRMDFHLPSRSGMGASLTAEALQTLQSREQPAVFFSGDLCAKYFTYTRDREPHFVLFDDADTLRRKIKLAAGMGIPAAFFLWQEVRDAAPALLAGQAIR